MRIAQIAPLHESVPPKLYGGTERVVSYLTEELVRQGHEVTLFASGDSQTSARLVPVCLQALRLDGSCVDPLAHHVLMLEQVYQHAHEFDILHFHIDYLHFPWSRRQGVPTLTTLHGRLDLGDLLPLYREFADAPVVSISNAQRQPLPWLNWQGTVYHGLPLDLYRPSVEPGKYLVFVGRISPEKGLDSAIHIAKQTALPLKVAAKVDRADRQYYESVIRPLLDHSPVEFLGEVNDAEKQELLGGALALLAPINWPEPFGLVMIEAMACGTPVIAFRRGSIPEIVDEGLTGFVVRNIDEAVAAVSRAAALSRYRVREHFEKRFSVERMTRGYVSIYNRMLEKSAVAPRVAVFPTRPFAGKPWMAQARPASDNEVSPSDGNY